MAFCRKCGKSGWVTICEAKEIEFTTIKGEKQKGTQYKNIGDLVCDCNCENAIKLRGSQDRKDHLISHYIQKPRIIRERENPAEAYYDKMNQEQFDSLVDVVPF